MKKINTNYLVVLLSIILVISVFVFLRNKSNGSAIYTNTEFGFEFSLPKNWSNYTASTTPADGDPGVIGVVSIFIPTNDSHWTVEPIGSFNVLRIVVWNKEARMKKWQACGANPADMECIPYNAVEIKNKNSKYDYVLFPAQQLPEDISRSVFVKNIDQVTKTFNVVQ